MESPARIKRWVSDRLPPQVRRWLWERKVAFGNRRIQALGRHLSRQVHEAEQKDLALMEGMSSKAEWECFCDERIDALRRTLRVGEDNPHFRSLRITSTLERDRYQIQNVVFHGHMNLPITANIYRPIRTTQKTPAIVMCHSHHDSKTEDELQCMGATWAQQGCTVLIMDLLGHGERRQHSLVSSSDSQEDFRSSRQDYYFRSVLGMQLQLVGESLMGWMVQDVKHGIDLLCADPQVDHDRIILIGAVAGGGDIAAMAGALDRRVAAVVAFNFGHLSIGDWDSTRNLSGTARHGFWPWVILASLAPRRLIYGREFSWNPQHDVVWQNLKRVYGFYGKGDALRSVYGSGRVSGHSPLDSHCINIGPIHRAQLYPIFQEWFDISVPEREVAGLVKKKDLECLTEDARKECNISRTHEVTKEICRKQPFAAGLVRYSNDPSARALQLQQELQEALGPMTPFTSLQVQSTRQGIGRSEYVELEVEDHIIVRLQLLWPSGSRNDKFPVVIGFAQEGNDRLRQKRRPLIQSLLRQGIVICLTELRGIGDGRHGELYRGRISPSAGVAATSVMLGESLLGSRVRDLRTVMAYLRDRNDLDQNRVGLWGDSLAATNSFSDDLAVPYNATPYPERGEPLGGVVALLSTLFEARVKAVYVHGGMVSYATLLDAQFIYQPTDVCIPNLLTIIDLPDIVAALAPRAIRMEGLVDGCNRQVNLRQVEESYQLARTAYAQGGENPGRLSMKGIRGSAEEVSGWFLSFL